MLAIFRADASLQIGNGHVMRCLALADALHAAGVECRFVCRDHPGHLGRRIEQEGHRLILLGDAATGPSAMDARLAHAAWLGCTQQQDADQTTAALEGDRADWLIVDHYALDERWERSLRPHAARVMVIDDLADRRHDCGLLLDQNLGRNQDDYEGLVPAQAKRLIGPRFALLRPEFARWRDDSLARRHEPALRRILVSMGGVDASNASAEVLRALQSCGLPGQAAVTVVMGENAPWLSQVRALATCMTFPCEVRSNVQDMAQLMADSDLAIGAAGSTSWERACLGLPAIVVVQARNQRAGAEALAHCGAASMIEAVDDIGTRLPALLAGFADAARLQAMSMAGRELVDGMGVSRVARELVG
ncbi:MAG TPA: UDP-2,4-diacetamido-2,4,6-trideoxy-beta-L-altropyranose hydrolase [Xanthomonadaceae bacterium]|jgi:UDP-2,4-diacetamido-2,4,6-trideoxy-beta-L-altropyranose hydrolase